MELERPIGSGGGPAVAPRNEVMKFDNIISIFIMIIIMIITTIMIIMIVIITHI